MEYYKNILKNRANVTLNDAIFRDEKLFPPADLRQNLDFWEHDILRDHPHKSTILYWIQGVGWKSF